MNKREFLAKLREYLSYELPEQLVRSEVQYYSDYIDSETAGGKSAESVVGELGDPQLIARTVIDAKKSGPDGIPGSADDIDYSGDVYGNRAGSGFGGNSERDPFGSEAFGGGNSYSASNDRESDRSFGGNGIHIYNMGCFSLILGMLVFFCIFSVIGVILGALSPFLIPVCMVMLILWLLGKTGRGGR